MAPWDPRIPQGQYTSIEWTLFCFPPRYQTLLPFPIFTSPPLVLPFSLCMYIVNMLLVRVEQSFAYKMQGQRCALISSAEGGANRGYGVVR